MNIVLFSGGLSGGGAERVICGLGNYLDGKGHHVTLLTMSDDTPDYTINHNINRIELLKSSERSGFLKNSLKRWWRLLRIVKKNKCNVYVVLLPLTTVLLLALRSFTKAKVIASERNDPRKYNNCIRCMLRLLAKRADGWVFQTEENRKWYEPLLEKRRTEIIPNAINLDFIRPKYSGESRKVIVSAGRMNAQKNQLLLVRAFATVSKNYPDYQLVIYGEGEKRTTLTSVAEELGIKDKVQLPGYTTSIGEKIKDASLFVLSSDFEGMPNALMEAMALGLPCISTDCDGGGAKFLIENEKNGLLVPKGDVDALAAAMKRMLSDREFAEHCGSEAHKICDRLAPEKIYGQWEEFIKEIVNGE